jgi:hypothetical protein
LPEKKIYGKPYFLFKGISGKNVPYGGAVLMGPLKPTHLPDVPGGGNVRLDRDTGRYFLLSTGLTPIDLVNPGVLEQRAGERTCR